MLDGEGNMRLSLLHLVLEAELIEPVHEVLDAVGEHIDGQHLIETWMRRAKRMATLQ